MRRYAGTEEDALMKLLSDVATQIGVAEHSYVVGGAVRDVALERDPKDVDVVVETKNGKNALTLGKALAERLGINDSSVVEDQYGVVHVGPVPHEFMYDGVDLKGQKIEIVTARKEYYERGKGKDWKPSEVEPGTIEDDLLRRDFAFNTLVFRLSKLADGPDKALIEDLLGTGLKDLEDGLLKTPVDPNETFMEDPTRMLRAVRMIVKYDMKFDPDTARAIRRNAKEIERIPEEKLSSELNKLLKGKDPRFAMKLMDAMGLLQYVMPELKALRGEKSDDMDRNVFEHVLKAVNSIDGGLVSRLVALFSELDRPSVREVVEKEIDFFAGLNFTAELAESIMKRLKYPNHVINPVVKLLKAQKGFDPELSDKELRRLKYELGDHLENLLDVIHAKNISRAKEFVRRDQIPVLRKRFMQMTEAGGAKFLERLENPPVNGHEIMRLLGLKRGGPMVGQAMELQREMILENPLVSEDKIAKAIRNRLLKRV